MNLFAFADCLIGTRNRKEFFMNKKLIGFLISTVFLGAQPLVTGCNDNDVPDVAGLYECTQGCGGNCDFGEELLVSQNGDDISVDVDPANDDPSEDTISGNIDEDGDYTVSNSETTCHGTFVNDVATVNCTVDGNQCQQATFQLKN